MPLFIIILLYATLECNINIFKIDENGIKINNPFVKFRNISWDEIKDIYIYQFNGTEKIRLPYKFNNKGVYKRRKYGKYGIGGVPIYIPRKIPNKWIFIDDGRGDNGENIFEYFVPLDKWSIIRIPYTNDIFSALEKNYKKGFIQKIIEL